MTNLKKKLFFLHRGGKWHHIIGGALVNCQVFFTTSGGENMNFFSINLQGNFECRPLDGVKST